MNLSPDARPFSLGIAGHLACVCSASPVSHVLVLYEYTFTTTLSYLDNAAWCQKWDSSEPERRPTSWKKHSEYVVPREHSPRLSLSVQFRVSRPVGSGPSYVLLDQDRLSMAFQIPPPQPMSLAGNKSQNWSDFRSEWEDYAIATGLTAKEKNDDGTPNVLGLKQSAATLRTVMGRDCVKVLKTLPTLAQADKEKPTSILTALSDHFVPQKNVLFDRYKFFTARVGSDTWSQVSMSRHMAGLGYRRY